MFPSFSQPTSHFLHGFGRAYVFFDGILCLFNLDIKKQTVSFQVAAMEYQNRSIE